MGIQLRENFQTGRVVVIVDNVPVYSDGEYRAAAEYAKRRFNLSDMTLMEIYRDYKEDYDNR